MSDLRCQGSSRQGGFTLLELLVVLLIIGIVVSMVTISVGGNETRALRDEAQRLTSLFDLVGQASVLNGREMAADLSEDGYQFLVYDGESWVPVTDGNEFRSRELPVGITLEAEIEGLSSDDDEDQSEEAGVSRVWFMSSGEVSPFSITLMLENSQIYYQLDGDMMGGMTLDGPLES